MTALYDSAGGTNWLDNDGWLASNTPCSWVGITCSQGHVTVITLSFNGLEGAIPSQLADLSSLAVLELSSNSLSGAIPPELGNATGLTHLYLSSNQLTGNIPTSLGDLEGLTYLYLADNRLSGSIPPELGQLGNLTRLDLSGNLLSSSLPPELGAMTSLRNLNLHNNRLGGRIPPDLGSLRGLARLDVGHNALEGEVPASMTNLTELDPAQTDVGFNMLRSSNASVAAFLAAKDPDWTETQTVPPKNLQAVTRPGGQVALTWDLIPYTADGGYYEVGFAPTISGPYMVHGTTIDKNSASYLLEDLSPETTYYFRLRTHTPAHDDQQNDLWSEYSSPISATTLPTHLPDLTINSMKIELETGGSCDYTSTSMGLRVFFENMGQAPAGPFVIEANYSLQAEVVGLSAGQRADLWFPGYEYPGENSAMVDATFLVDESNEDNNRLTQILPIPTLPATCTPTITATSTATATPTTTPTPTPTPTTTATREIQTQHLPMLLRNYGPTSTPTPTATPTMTPLPPCWPDCEANGTFAQAQGPLTSGAQYRGYIDSPQDQSDYFYLNLEAAHTIEGWLREIPAGANYHLYLYNDETELVGYSGQPSNEDEHILTNTLPAGRYYVRVQRASGFSSTQPYSLRVVFR